MPKPNQWSMQHHNITKPAPDNDYFERMSRVIFMSGLNWKILEKKLPGIQRAFVNFDIDKVASFLEPEIEEVMMSPDVIHNLAKVRAVVANAKEFQKIAVEHQNFASYLQSLRSEGGEEHIKQAIAKRFAFMGKGTTPIFLFSAGENMPETIKQWQKEHGNK